MAERESAPVTPAELRRSRRLRRAAVLLVSGAVVAVACTGRHADPAMSRPGTLILASAGPLHEDMLEGQARQLLFLPLIDEDSVGAARGAVTRGWEQSEDGRDWTFHLRSNIRWQDGVPLTAADVLFTLQLSMRLEVDRLGPGRVSVLDDSTVVVRMEWAVPEAQEWMSVPILPRHLLARQPPARFRDWEFWRHPIGDGPYRFVRWVPHTAIELQADSGYFRGAPRIPRVLLRASPEGDMADLLAGEVDETPLMNPGQALRVERDGRFRLYPHFSPAARMAILWRTDHPLFADPRVRRALTLAIDRPGLLKVVVLPETTPLSDGLYTERQFRRGQLPAPLPFDPAQAAALLDAAGWRDRDGDGIRDRDGRAFHFTLLAPNMGYGAQQSSVFIREQLRRVGVDAEIAPLDYTLVLDRLRRRDFDAAIERIFMQPMDLAALLGHDGDNELRYANLEMSRLIEAATARRFAPDIDTLYARMTRIFRADLPATALFPLTEVVAAHRRVRGIRPSTTMSHVAAWWLEDSLP